ncbi:MAG TPA: periplasmic heavy metal sensor [candidate division Zixibacteria bacterium]|mgnify:CR=1 FL=1|nr:periplasmic heavy metal sensor [candidate division Zixibacteria bacterium]
MTEVQKNNQTRYGIGIIIVLVCLNIVSVTLLWFQYFDRPPQPQERGNDPQDFLIQELQFDAQQADSLRTMRCEYMHFTDSIRLQVAQLNEQLFSEVFADNPDTVLVNRVAEEIGSRQSEIQQMLFAHFEQIRQICRPEQEERLKGLILNIFQGGRIPPPERMEGNPFTPPEPPMDGRDGRMPPPMGDRKPPPQDKERTQDR